MVEGWNNWDEAGLKAELETAPRAISLLPEE